MHFVVFGAYALVLWLQPGYEPSGLLGGRWIALGAAGALALGPGLIGGITSLLVLARLETEPAKPQVAQRLYTGASAALRGVLLAGFAGLAWLTEWISLVRHEWGLGKIWGLDEHVVLLPFLMGVMIMWLGLYPADRAIRQLAVEARVWASAPVRPVWRTGEYLIFNLRHQLLIVLLPMLPVLVALDATRVYRKSLAGMTGIIWTADVVLFAVAGVVFLLAPVMLRHIWSTRVLPPGELRDRLERMCRQMGLRCRQILIWRSNGLIVNAAVAGLLAPVRYILLSDGLLETMDDEKIEAVFAHEAGHVKKHHILFLVMFAGASLMVASGFVELARARWPQLQSQWLEAGALVLLAVIWLVGFGWVSRRFERQADVFGVRCVTASVAECRLECRYHGSSDARSSRRLLCSTAAAVFANALERIAILNGIPLAARSWRHSSIVSRARLVRELAAEPSALLRFQRVVAATKVALIVVTGFGAAMSAWVYWPF